MAYPIYEDNGGVGTGVDYSVAVPYPATVNADDILICAVMDADDDSFDTPSGWNKTVEFTTHANMSVAYYWKRALGTETGTETFTSTKNAGSLVAGMMARFSGCHDVGNPFDVTSTYGVTGPGTNVNMPSIPTYGTERLVFNIVVIEDNVSCTTAAPDSWTEVFYLSTSVGSDAAFKGQTIPVPTPLTVSGDTCTLGGSDYHSTQCMSLIPYVAPTGWPHNFLSVPNASIGKITGVLKADIEAVNTAT